MSCLHFGQCIKTSFSEAFFILWFTDQRQSPKHLINVNFLLPAICHFKFYETTPKSIGIRFNTKGAHFFHLNGIIFLLTKYILKKTFKNYVLQFSFFDFFLEIIICKPSNIIVLKIVEVCDKKAKSEKWKHWNISHRWWLDWLENYKNTPCIFDKRLNKHMEVQ